MYKVYCGKDAAIVGNDDFTIIFLRIRDDNIISILKDSSSGIVSIVSGRGKNFDAHTDYCFINQETGRVYVNSPDLADELEKHKKDTVSVNGDLELIYTTYNGIEYRLQIAEELDVDKIRMTDDEIHNMSLSDKMRLWNCGEEIEFSELDNGFVVSVEMNTEKYSATFNIDSSNNFIYCRFGMHGYCNKGWAMLSTICIRQNECRMISDNTEALKGYIPDEKCFVANGCSFPSDGGWYWSVRDVDDNTVYLNGCGGDSYEIHRR